LNLKGR